MAKRSCRRTTDENLIHKKAVEMRKKTDEQLVHYVDLKNKDMRCKQCENYIVTNEHAERLRKKIKVVKK